jgi:hypothetical protein
MTCSRSGIWFQPTSKRQKVDPRVSALLREAARVGRYDEAAALCLQVKARGGGWLDLAGAYRAATVPDTVPVRDVAPLQGRELSDVASVAPVQVAAVVKPVAALSAPVAAPTPTPVVSEAVPVIDELRVYLEGFAAEMLLDLEWIDRRGDVVTSRAAVSASGEPAEVAGAAIRAGHAPSRVTPAKRTWEILERLRGGASPDAAVEMTDNPEMFL